MVEITEAGGIGCFSKQPARTDLESQQPIHGSILLKPDFQHHSGSAHDSEISNIETANNVPRLYGGHRESSSSVRNESRLIASCSPYAEICYGVLIVVLIQVHENACSVFVFQFVCFS
jgi:hypothetical protein